jgi:hypothetical protein
MQAGNLPTGKPTMVRHDSQIRLPKHIRSAWAELEEALSSLTKTDVLRKLSFGNQVAEEERDTLKEYFVANPRVGSLSERRE